MALRASQLIRASLRHYRWTHSAVVLGVAVATAVLTGALLVGDSMRGSLREMALRRLGRVEFVLQSQRFVDGSLPSRLKAAAGDSEETVGLILLRGSATNPESGSHVNAMQVLGVPDDFWELGETQGRFPVQGEVRGKGVLSSIILNEPLAQDLGVQKGDDVLLRVGRPETVASETLLGRRDDRSQTLRLTVERIIPDEGIGLFGVDTRQTKPRNAFIPLAALQRALSQPDKINAILTFLPPLPRGDQGGPSRKRVDLSPWQIGTMTSHSWQARLQAAISLSDLGLRLRQDEKRGYVSLESAGLLLEPPVEKATIEALEELGLYSIPIQTYLANAITLIKNSTERRESFPSVPYSTVTAMNIFLADGGPLYKLKTGELILNGWAAKDLGATVGDTIALTYYVSQPLGELEERTSDFRLFWIWHMDEHEIDDPGFAPEYPGITDSTRLSDWDPPFPMDLKRIRPKDEEYWKKYRTAPKAFISLEDGRRLWAEQGERFGSLTSIRFWPQDHDFDWISTPFERELFKRLDVSEMGLRFEPVRERALAAAEGSTDFGMLFLGFSFFLILSAAMLVALLFRLSIERRASEIGLLLATGIPQSRIHQMMIGEGACLALVGTFLGIPCAVGYAWLMLAGLRTWWSAAVNAPFLQLHVSTTSLAIGLGVSFVVALVSIAWSIRGLTRISPHSLLNGAIRTGRVLPSAHPQRAVWIGICTALVGGILLALPWFMDSVSASGAFFGSGAAWLTACLSLVAWRLSPVHLLQSEPQASARGAPGAEAILADRNHVACAPCSDQIRVVPSLLQLSLRNAPRHRVRSLLTVGLIASATFLIIAISSFRLEPNEQLADRTGGSGGFALMAEAAVPLSYDLNTSTGQEALGLSDTTQGQIAHATFIPFRLRGGEESSCLNVYRPTRPRIIGATSAMIERGGFSFAASMAHSDDERTNPWMLLNHHFADGAIPVIGDEAAVRWQFHLGLGKDLEMTDDRGRPVQLRFVGLLAGSVLQSELIISEANFVDLFPTVGGYAFFLIDTWRTGIADFEPLSTLGGEGRVEGNMDALLATAIERDLAPYGFDVRSSRERLAEYFAVQNTYLSTFQTLGGLGLLLGTVGLAAVLLRNVWERRSELALLRALGFTQLAIGSYVLIENAALLLTGLLCGAVAALVSVIPQILSRALPVPLGYLVFALLAVVFFGMSAAIIALIPTLRGRLLTALRSE